MAKDDLFNELAKEVKKANARIDRIEKSFGKGSWGTKRVQAFLENEKLNAIKNGKISISKSMSDVQLRAIKDVTEKFLKSESTSTVRGIKQTMKNVRSGLKRSFDLSDAEVEEIYMLFEDDEYKQLVHSYREYESDIVQMTVESQRQKISQDSWLEKVQNYITFAPESSTAKHLKNIYKNHIK